MTETEVDSRRFEWLFERARQALAGGDPERTANLVRETLGLWRGQALTDLEEWELGLDPGHQLVELEEQLLRQDPALDPVLCGR